MCGAFIFASNFVVCSPSYLHFLYVFCIEEGREFNKKKNDVLKICKDRCYKCGIFFIFTQKLFSISIITFSCKKTRQVGKCVVFSKINCRLKGGNYFLQNSREFHCDLFGILKEGHIISIQFFQEVYSQARGIFF